MARLASNQRVVTSMKDRSGNAYTKTSAGGKARAGSAVKYMDEDKKTRLYRLEEGYGATETDRHEALERIRETETRYQQHLAFTTKLPGDLPMLPRHERSTVEMLAQAIQARRPDAEIYALAVHQQEQGNIHVHVVFGTATTLRRDDLAHLRELAFQMEQRLKRELELSPLRLDRGKEIELRGEISREGVAVKQVDADDSGSGTGKTGGKAPTLDLNDLKGERRSPRRNSRPRNRKHPRSSASGRWDRVGLRRPAAFFSA
ncbi:hypothetical protein ACFP9V_23640 [Deinococcus radiopugnans]|uniref:hypothetical protein n=1 Tax=Deinococcus radiopugnans TaxID=57497 RepID=UPI003620C3D4